MDFGTQIKNLRISNKLTQQEFADKLSISRQAISNWENNKNLPDICMLIQISCEFDISLDELILGGKNMNNMTEKVIKDASENHRAKLNLASTIIGAVCMVLGFFCFIIFVLPLKYVDVNGILHELFYLIPSGFILLFCGAVLIIGTAIRFIIKKFN